MGFEKFYLFLYLNPGFLRFLTCGHTKTAEVFFLRRFAVDVVFCCSFRRVATLIGQIGWPRTVMSYPNFDVFAKRASWQIHLLYQPV
jgi:hypothetical protein